MRLVAPLSVFLPLLLAQPVLAQSAPDSAAPAPGLPPLDRYVIDAATLVRESGARSLADVLISQVPGLLVVPGSGLNGGGSRIRFAGPRTLVDDAAPLVLVDGIRVDQAEDVFSTTFVGASPLRLEDFSVEEIDSIEVIGSAATAAIYGPGASGGVISIHTKRGRSGPLRWEAHAQGGVAMEPSRWPTNYGGVDADNSSALMRSGGCTLLQESRGNCVQDYVQSFDPLEQRDPFGTPFRRQLGLSATGGPQWGGFRLGAGIEGDAGAYSVPGVASDPNYYRRRNLLGSAGVRPLRQVDIAVTVGLVSSDLRLPPNLPMQTLFGPSDSTGFTWAQLFRNRATQAVERTTGSMEIHWRPLIWLEVSGLAGLDEADQKDATVDPDTAWLKGHRRTRQQTSALRLSAVRSLQPRLRLTTTLGVERLASRLDHRIDFGLGPPGSCALACGGQSLSTWQHSLGYYLVEQVDAGARVSVVGTLRHDRFEETHLSATHPSLLVAWLARRDSGGPLGRLRLHAAYGTAGRPPAMDLATFALFQPEQTRSVEVGADAGLLAGRWNAGLTFYDMRSDVIDPTLLSTSTGFTTGYALGGKISNQGVAATLAGAILPAGAVRWDLRLSLWGNRNRLATFASPPIFLGLTMQRLIPGYPVGGYWAFPIESYADANSDGIITPNEVVFGAPNWVGTPYPTQGALLTSTWHVRNRWHVTATLDYRAGQTLFNETAWHRCTAGFAVCRDANDPATPLAAQATASGSSFAPIPPRYFEDGDYLKLRELALSFEVPAGVLGTRAATISLAGRNLATWTRYSGPDPESGTYGLRSAEGYQIVGDYATLPPPRTWTLRVQLGY